MLSGSMVLFSYLTYFFALAIQLAYMPYLRHVVVLWISANQLSVLVFEWRQITI